MFDSSKLLLKLYNAEKVETVSDALTILLHVHMLESGFVPVGQNNSLPESMPKDWKCSGTNKIQYFHKCSQETLCWMTCIPMSTLLVVCGTIHKAQLNSVNIQLEAYYYVNQNRLLSSLTNISDMYQNIDELSRTFKDKFSYSLLTTIQNYIGFSPVFGLAGLLEDLKLHILSFLPVSSIGALASVNKEFHDLTSSSTVWKQLYFRDFSNVSDKGVPDKNFNASEEIDFKDMYKKEYLKQQSVQSTFLTSPRIEQVTHFPHRLIGNDIGSGIDMRIDLDPDIQIAFPHLRDRFRPRNPLLQQLFPNRWSPFSDWYGYDDWS